MADAENNLNLQPEAPAQEAEKTFSQDEVNSLIGRNKQEERERVRRQLEEEHQRKLRDMQAQYEQKTFQERENDSNMANAADFSQVDRRVQDLLDQREREAQERAKQQEFDNELQTVVGGYEERLKEAKALDPDIEQALKPFNPGAFPNLVVAVHNLPKGMLAIKSLMQDPKLFKDVNDMAMTDTGMAQQWLSKIVQDMESQKENIDAAGNMPPPPLDQPNPSNVNNGDSENASISQVRSLDWLRG